MIMIAALIPRENHNLDLRAPFVPNTTATASDLNSKVDVDFAFNPAL